MSREQRNEISYWAGLILGIAILSMQFYKYCVGTLELTIEEGCVFGLGVLLMRNINAISNAMKSRINSKNNESDKS